MIPFRIREGFAEWRAVLLIAHLAGAVIPGLFDERGIRLRCFDECIDVFE